MCPLKCVAPLGGIDDYTHETSTDDAGNWQGNNPSTINPQHHAPIDTLIRTGAKPNADSRTNNALGS